MTGARSQKLQSHRSREGVAAFMKLNPGRPVSVQSLTQLPQDALKELESRLDNPLPIFSNFFEQQKFRQLKIKLDQVSAT